MGRLRRYQTVLCIMVSLFIYGLTWYGLLLTLNNQHTPILNSSSLNGSPFNNKVSFVEQLIVWQISEANIVATEKPSELKSSEIASRNPSEEKATLKHGLPIKNFLSTKIKNYNIDYPDTIFTCTGITDYQIMDIPPPRISAS